MRLPTVSVLVAARPGARTLLLPSLLVVLLGACAQRSTSDADAPDNYDLSAVPLRLDMGWLDSGVQELANAIGDARVVMLGEQWHGDGGAIRVRSEIVRLLHERMGFDVLALEADFYSLQRGWEAVRAAGDVGAMAQENIYHFWSTSRAAQPLWDYVEAQRGTDRPLDVAGVDTRHVGALAYATLPAELDQRLADIVGVSSEERTRFRETLERLLIDEFGDRPPAGEQEAFFTVLDRLSAALTARDSAGREPFWEHEVRNLRNAAMFAWHGANRDRAMGENLAWLATHAYPGRKIIVWAHNNHIITDKWMYFSSDDTLAVSLEVARGILETIAGITYLGHEARQFFGPDVFSLAVLSHSGTYSPDVRTENLRQYGNFDSLAVLSPAAEGTIEAALANAGHEIAFVDLRQVAPVSRPARGLDYHFLPPMQMRWHEGFDGFLFIRTTFGLNEEPPADWAGRGAER